MVVFYRPGGFVVVMVVVMGVDWSRDVYPVLRLILRGQAELVPAAAGEEFALVVAAGVVILLAILVKVFCDVALGSWSRQRVRSPGRRAA